MSESTYTDKEETLPTTVTCGGPARRTQFDYEGDFDNGIIIRFASGETPISHSFLRAAVDHFRGREVKWRFLYDRASTWGIWSMGGEPICGLKYNTIDSLGMGLFIAAILRHGVSGMSS